MSTMPGSIAAGLSVEELRKECDYYSVNHSAAPARLGTGFGRLGYLWFGSTAAMKIATAELMLGASFGASSLWGAEDDGP